MKAGVITFHSANNYGAVLQAWALQKVLKSYGIDTGVIHYHPDVIDRLYDPLFMERGIKRQIKKLKLAVTNRKSLVRYRKYRRFLSKNIKLLGDYETYQELSQAGLNLDVYITGSDQIWNPEHTGGFDPAYYLCFAEEGKRKLSYGASVGSDYINPKYKEYMRRSLSSFTGISVRESSMKDQVQETAGRPVSVVLDPALLLTREDYEEIKRKSTRKEPYIIVYMVEYNEQIVCLANTLSVSLGLPVVQRKNTSGLINELENFYTADAGEFIGLIEAAEYVITNSFHGTVFSILYEKPFVSMLHSNTGSRVADLLAELGLESHLLYDIADFTGITNFETADPELLQQRLEERRQASLKFLSENLGIPEKLHLAPRSGKLAKDQCDGCSVFMECSETGAICMK